MLSERLHKTLWGLEMINKLRMTQQYLILRQNFGVMQMIIGTQEVESREEFVERMILFEESLNNIKASAEAMLIFLAERIKDAQSTH